MCTYVFAQNNSTPNGVNISPPAGYLGIWVLLDKSLCHCFGTRVNVNLHVHSGGCYVPIGFLIIKRQPFVTDAELLSNFWHKLCSRKTTATCTQIHKGLFWQTIITLNYNTQKSYNKTELIHIRDYTLCYAKIVAPELIPQSSERGVGWRWGLLKFVNFAVRKIFDLAKVSVKFF